MSIVLQLNDKKCAQVGSAGGKGASLARMVQAGFAVPKGVVVSARAFKRFLDETELMPAIETELKRVKVKDINSVDRASNVIRGMILGQQMPRDIGNEILYAYQKQLGAKAIVAVRSSATAEDSKTASWAGELETYLNVKEKDLIESVKKCWASLFTPRAIYYRFEKGLHREEVSVAVVVQEMVGSEVSGVCFTVHPVTKDKNQMVIEACFGLGEALVSGQITPDAYVVHKDDGSLLEANISGQEFEVVQGGKGSVKRKLPASRGGRQKLTGEQITVLAKICNRIERYYRHPQDIEWAYAKNKFHILQSRPITTL